MMVSFLSCYGSQLKESQPLHRFLQFANLHLDPWLLVIQLTHVTQAVTAISLTRQERKGFGVQERNKYDGFFFYFFFSIEEADDHKKEKMGWRLQGIEPPPQKTIVPS